MNAAHSARRISAVKLLSSLAAVTMVGVVGFVGTTAALSDTTENAGNEFNAGEISIEDNDSAAFMYNVDNALPGETTEACIQVSYTSTVIDSNVVLYLGSTIGSVGPYVDMTVEAGTQATPTFPSCSGFVPTASLYTGTLGGFAADHGSAATGVAFSPRGASPWQTGDTAVYRVTLTVSNTVRAPGENFSGVHTYTWRADSA